MIALPQYLLLDALIGKKGGDSQYGPTFEIASLNATPNVIEVGATQAVLLTWVINPSGTDPDSQSINQGIGSISPSLRTVMSNPLSSTFTFVLTVIKNLTAYNKNVVVNFRRKRYWFVSSDPDFGIAPFTYGDLPAVEQEFATERQKANVTYDCTGGKYIYYMYPAEFGISDENHLINNGFTVELSPSSIRTVDFTNQPGDTSSYVVLRSDNLLHGNEIMVSFL